MKFLPCTAFAALMFMAIGSAKAQGIGPVSQERYNCMIERAQALGRAGDPRYSRLAREVQRRGGADASRRQRAAGSLVNTRDARSMQADVQRHCR